MNLVKMLLLLTLSTVGAFAYHCEWVEEFEWIAGHQVARIRYVCYLDTPTVPSCYPSCNLNQTVPTTPKDATPAPTFPEFPVTVPGDPTKLTTIFN